MVLRNLSRYAFDDDSQKDMVTLVKGYFHQTLQRYAGPQIALLHIDADLYHSYKVILETLWPQVAVGGIVAFDEYQEPENWPGARKAVDEFLESHKDDMMMYRDSPFDRYYAVKVR